ncbi:MAG: rhodanese-like domain-containing protein [Candidatus Omnitrophica bacterium]|nr:rhodanese-like domain-containing protein [Candidatus Omnitrophota bacterium]
MEKVLELYPAAQRALFQKYHIGGCSSCGFSPQDTLETVCQNHDQNPEEVIEHLKKSYELDEELQIAPVQARDRLTAGNGARFIDVRDEHEHALARIEGSKLATQELVEEMMRSWPKDTLIIVYCHYGNRSLDAAAYLIGHGFKNVKSLKGGIDAWSREVDPKVPRY